MSSSSSNNSQEQQQQEDNILFKLTSPSVNNDQAKQQLTSPHAALAFALHLLMVQRGFRCVGLAESDPIREYDDNSGVPPEGWNRSSDVFSFKYKHSQSSMTFVLKCVTLGDRLLVHALAIEDKNPHALELNVNDFVDSQKLSNKSNDLCDFFKQLDQLETLFKINISAKLVPFMNKDGYEANSNAVATTSSSSDNNRNPRQQPSSDRPRTLLEDDYDPLRIGPPRQPRSRLQQDPFGFPANPYNVGHEDLYPDLGMPFGTGPRLPFHPGTGSMVGPNHPAFGGSGNVFNPPRYGPPVNLPRGVPPRARFDPYGPPGTGNTPNPNPDHLRRPNFNNDDDPFYL